MQIRTITGDYIRGMLSKKMREDGRDFFSYRDIKLKTHFIPNAEGSAEAMIGYTKVLAGVKIDVGEPMPDKPEEGNLITSAELLSIASEEFESGPPGPEAIELARVVDRGIRAANLIDTSALFIEEDKVWSVYVDLYVLNYDGNLFDACTLAATTALMNTRMPRYEDEKVIREGKLGKLKTDNLATSCTFAKIGNHIVIDPDGNEEAFMDTRITISNDEEYIRAMQKGLGGAFSFKEIEELVNLSFEKSKELRSIVKKTTGE